METIILASQSPRRKTLLEWAEIPFEIVVSATDESYPADMPIEEVPVHIARGKAMAVKEKAGTSHPVLTTVLAADTIVVLDETIMGKPVDRDDAIRMLTALSGRQHRVITGVVILHENGEIAFADITEVHFHTLTQEQIIFYADKYRPFDKAGAYAIQEWIGVVGIRSVKGDFYNVMGLPVSRVMQVLQSLAP